jgi:Protein of unknown function (DUF3108)
MRIILWFFFLLLCALTFPASLFGSASTPVHLAYQTYALGIPVASLSSTLDLGGQSYRLDLAFHTIGIAAVLSAGHQRSIVQGTWDGDRPIPHWFTGDGVWHGENRHVLIEYHYGQPSVLSLVPPADPDREPVPPAMTANTVDQLSAIALVIHRVAETGRCDASAQTYDGRRLAVFEAVTVGEETLIADDRSSFRGRALRCDFQGRLIAGFMRGAGEEARQPKHGSAWLAPIVPGAPPLPVRITFETSWLGQATMYLTAASPELPPSAAAHN